MNKKLNLMKSSLMGSSTMPLGTLGANPFPMAHSHVHSADGSCCGHDHHHEAAETPEHVHDEHCNHGKE